MTLLGLFQLAALALLFVLIAGRALHLKWAHGIQALTIGKGKRGLAWVIEVAFLPFVLAWMIEVVLVTSGLPFRLLPAPFDRPLIDSVIVQGCGVVLLVAALSIFMLALIAFGRSWRVGIDEERPGELVRRGIFAVSRNPIFVALDLYFLGTLLINGTLTFLLFTLLMVLGVHYQILQEEQFLRQHYGSAYKDYCQKTSRYFGWRN